MRGDGEEELGRDANTTRWDPLQLLSRCRQGMAEPSSESPLLSPSAASTVPRYVGWFGERRGDKAALAQRKRARGFRGKHCSTLLVWHHRFCTQMGGWGKEGGHVASQQCLLQPCAVSLASPGIQPLRSHWVSNHPTDAGDPSPSSVQTSASSGIAPCKDSTCLC